MVADFERISIEQVWSLGVIHFLNDLLYLKLKQQFDADQYRRSSGTSNK